MVARSSRSGSPGVRLGLALLASFVLHIAVFFPYFPAKKQPPPAPDLIAILMPEEAPQEPVMQPPEPQVEEVQVPAPPVAVPPAPTFTPTPEPPKPLAGQALKSALTQMAREEFYPREAIARGLEGRVVLLLVLAGSGRVMSIEVASSSGHALLDEAAMVAASRIGHIPGGRRQVLLPVEFRLE